MAKNNIGIKVTVTVFLLISLIVSVELSDVKVSSTKLLSSTQIKMRFWPVYVWGKFVFCQIHFLKVIKHKINGASLKATVKGYLL